MLHCGCRGPGCLSNRRPVLRIAERCSSVLPGGVQGTAGGGGVFLPHIARRHGLWLTVCGRRSLLSPEDVRAGAAWGRKNFMKSWACGIPGSLMPLSSTHATAEKSGCPGPGLDGARHLVAKGVASVAAENRAVPFNPGKKLAFPVHGVLPTGPGDHICENIQTAERTSSCSCRACRVSRAPCRW